MTREELLAYLSIEYDYLLLEADIGMGDDVDGLGPVLDHAEAVFTRFDGLTDIWQRQVASYYALDRIVSRMAVNMAVSISGDSYNLKHQYDNAKKLRDEMYAKVWRLVDPPLPGEIDDGDKPGTLYTLEMPFLSGGDEWP